MRAESCDQAGRHDLVADGTVALPMRCTGDAMKIKRRSGRMLFVFAILCPMSVVSGADSPLLITLKLDRDHTLPGIPVTMRFTAFNKSARPVTMMDVLAL